MYVQKRIDKNGETYYSFSYLDDSGKRVRLSKKEHPHFRYEEEAREWAKTQTAYRQASKDFIQKKLAWKIKFYDFEPLLKRYADWQQVHAPNSWENNVYHIEQFILPWFLGEKLQNNVNGWHFLFQDFITYLRKDCRTAKGDRKISIAMANNIIHSLNSFTRFLSVHNLLDPSAAIKCTAFPEHMTNQKGFDEVILEPEFDVIYRKLEVLNQASADMFLLLYRTGMRINEALGIPMSFLFKGEMTGVLHDELKDKKISYIGYLVLESQPEGRGLKRDPETHKVNRKPLKARKLIQNKDNRLIPIRDKSVWNMLARRYKAQNEKLLKAVYGHDPINYLLFDDLTYNTLACDLRQVYKGTVFKAKGPHSCRHSFATIFTGETRSFLLAKLILGHKSKAFEGYLHLYEAISLQAKRNSQEIDEIG